MKERTQDYASLFLALWPLYWVFTYIVTSISLSSSPYVIPWSFLLLPFTFLCFCIPFPICFSFYSLAFSVLLLFFLHPRGCFWKNTCTCSWRTLLRFSLFSCHKGFSLHSSLKTNLKWFKVVRPRKNRLLECWRMNWFHPNDDPNIPIIIRIQYIDL